jgi:calcineurin-like phosphoesterase family protein
MITYTLEEAENKWFAADLHLDHRNIIRYCHRPFKNVDEMNRKLVRNWNETVGQDDTVYFVGDFCYGKYSRHPAYWLHRLNGRVIFIEGSHDRKIPRCLMRPYERISVDGVELLLIHNYLDAKKDGILPLNWKGWIVHGHNHGRRDFFQPNHRRINVSMEVINYKPISLAEVVETIQNGGGK